MKIEIIPINPLVVWFMINKEETQKKKVGIKNNNKFRNKTN